MGITREGKLRRELDQMTDVARNSENVIRVIRSERDTARHERDEVSGKFLRLEAMLLQQRQHVRRLFNSIFHVNLDLARKAGYIDRVKEMDSANGLSARVTEPMSDIVDQERDNLYGARSERMVNSIIDGMDPDILDQVLGRNDDMDYERG